MSACSACLHYSKCMERRGQCREYITLEMIRRQIIELNDANQKTASARSAADKGVQKFGVSGVPRRDGDPEDKAQ